METLTKGANAAVAADYVRVSLTWAPGRGMPDVDVSALLCRETGKVGSDDDFVFFNQVNDPSGTVRHLGKTATAGIASDTLEVALARLPATVDKVVIAASADGPFGQIRSLAVSVLDVATAQTLLTFPMTASTETAFIAGELYRRGGAWKFRAVGQGYTDGLAGLARDFGITVDDPAPTPAPPSPAPSAQPVVTSPSGAGQIDWMNPPVPAGYEI